MIVKQMVSDLRKALATNATTASFTIPAATVTRPSGNLVLDLNATPGQTQNGRVKLFPYGLGSANDAFSMRLWGWHHVGNDSAGNILWVPSLLVELACTVGAATGVANSPVLNTELFCDTITVVSEPSRTADVTRAGETVVYSPANDSVAWAAVMLHGAELLQWDFDQTTNTPTMNCLYAFLAENV